MYEFIFLQYNFCAKKSTKSTAHFCFFILSTSDFYLKDMAGLTSWFCFGRKLISLAFVPSYYHFVLLRKKILEIEISDIFHSFFFIPDSV